MDDQGAGCSKDCYEFKESEKETCLERKTESNTTPEGGRSSKPTQGCALLKWLPSFAAFVALVAVIIMSFSDIFVEIATQSVNPIQVTLLGGLSMFVSSFMCLVVHSIKNEDLLRRRYGTQAWFYLLSCAIANFSGIILINIGINFMPVGDAVSILRSMPIFAGIIGWVFLKQALRVIDFLFILFCITGVSLIARPSFLFRQDEPEANSTDNKLLGTVFSLGSAVSFAISFSVGRKLSDKKIHSFVIISINSFANLLLSSVICFAMGAWDCPGHFYIVVMMVGAGVFTAVGQILVFWSLSRERVVVITVILASNIIFVNVLQILVVGIIPHWLSGVGAVLILTACIGMAVRRDDAPAVTEVVSP
ncbi:Solute carrier family 35 member G1 [Holothuria leucospilota]|uniref:Solute carrier family 35 member G1 n=1 Tax=Holothuria leucospilota TaxID=206669 RepID=A0A9Q1C9Z9_HOLLE|nr:Solute carrier family 35 member G1 [Holothuria leucospilota]